MKSAADVDNPKFHKLFEDASAINHATADDPPVMLFYPQANDPLPPNSTSGAAHSPPQARLRPEEKLDQLGVGCTLLLKEQYPGGAPVDEFVKFFLERFRAAPSVQGRAVVPDAVPVP